MSRRRSKQNTKQRKAKQTTQPSSKDMASSNLCNADITFPDSLDASRTSATPNQDTKRFKIKRWIMVITALATVIIAGLALLPTFHQARFGQEANDRTAGRLKASAKILHLIPDMESMKHLFIPLDPPPRDVFTGKPINIVFFKDLYTLCQTNPRILVKNTGNEAIEAVRIEVEELSVIPVGGKDPIFIPDPSNPKVPRLIRYKPILDPTQSDNCDLSEKFKPGDEAIIPLWRPLIRAMLKAQKVKSQSGKYKAAFDVRCYARAVGATAFDRLEGSTPLGFIWSAVGFTEEGFKRIQDGPIVVKVVAKNQNPAEALARDLAF